ncbi:MAG: prepilin-type N-terminal cleavage/methylation domain-containing protein [Bacilli bacterium]|nr:prepilin-type N-terminal cleavage/methylation domain-containing protein [Bacilli bacterium]
MKIHIFFYKIIFILQTINSIVWRDIIKKGVTLVELLVVVTVLALLFIAAVPNLVSMFRGAEELRYEAFINNIKTATSVYTENNIDELKGLADPGNTIYITLNDLVENRLLREPIIDPKTNTELSLLSKVKITKVRDNIYDIELVLE